MGMNAVPVPREIRISSRAQSPVNQMITGLFLLLVHSCPISLFTRNSSILLGEIVAVFAVG